MDNHIQIAKEVLRQYVGTYRYDDAFQMIISMKGNDLYVRCPKVRLPNCRLYAVKENYFYIREAPLKFELLKTADNGMKMVTYNNSGKDAEWIRIK